MAPFQGKAPNLGINVNLEELALEGISNNSLFGILKGVCHKVKRLCIAGSRSKVEEWNLSFPCLTELSVKRSGVSSVGHWPETKT